VTSVEVRLSETEDGWRKLASDFSSRLKLPRRRKRRGLIWMVAAAFAVTAGALPLFSLAPDPPPVAGLSAPLPNAVPPRPAPKQPLHKRTIKKLKKKKR
jgi:hypothetical protein